MDYDRTARIKASLSKINSLMNELKEANEQQQLKEATMERFTVLPCTSKKLRFDKDSKKGFVVYDNQYNEWNLWYKTRKDAQTQADRWNEVEQRMIDNQRRADEIAATKPRLVYSAPLSDYDIMLRRISKHNKNAAAKSAERTKRASQAALRLCKKTL